MEIDYTATLSDYLDDAGGVYYDQQLLGSEMGEASAYLSNPATQNTQWFAEGQARGKDGTDGFFSFTLVLTRNITYKNYRPKKSEEEEISLINQ